MPKPKRKSPPPKLDAQHLRAVTFITAGRRQVDAGEQTMAQGVALGRHAGLSWARIAAAAGLTERGAQKKYAGSPAEMVERFITPAMRAEAVRAEAMTEAELDVFYGDAGSA